MLSSGSTANTLLYHNRKGTIFWPSHYCLTPSLPHSIITIDVYTISYQTQWYSFEYSPTLRAYDTHKDHIISREITIVLWSGGVCGEQNTDFIWHSQGRYNKPVHLCWQYGVVDPQRYCITYDGNVIVQEVDELLMTSLLIVTMSRFRFELITLLIKLQPQLGSFTTYWLPVWYRAYLSHRCRRIDSNSGFIWHTPQQRDAASTSRRYCSASVWPSPRQTPGPSCQHPSDSPPSGHHPDRRQDHHAPILQLGLNLTQPWSLWTPPQHGPALRISIENHSHHDYSVLVEPLQWLSQRTCTIKSVVCRESTDYHHHHHVPSSRRGLEEWPAIRF